MVADQEWQNSGDSQSLSETARMDVREYLAAHHIPGFWQLGA